MGAPDGQDSLFQANDLNHTLYYVGNLTYGYSLGGSVVGTPAGVGTSSPYTFDTFVHGTDSQVYWNHYGPTWSGFTGQGITVVSAS